MDYRKAILMLMYATAKADAAASAQESAVIYKNAGFYLGYSREDCDIITQEYLNGIGQGSFNSVSETLVGHIPATMHMGVMEMLIEVANIDINEDVREDMFIECVNREMRLPSATLMLLRNVVLSRNFIIHS